MNGIERIAAERKRQIDVKGYTPEHDDEHTVWQLAAAAQSYIITMYHTKSLVPWCWPWKPEWWEPSDDPIRNLEKAGALIAAEIDRLLRLRERQTGEPK